MDISVIRKSERGRRMRKRVVLYATTVIYILLMVAAVLAIIALCGCFVYFVHRTMPSDPSDDSLGGLLTLFKYLFLIALFVILLIAIWIVRHILLPIAAAAITGIRTIRACKKETDPVKRNQFMMEDSVVKIACSAICGLFSSRFYFSGLLKGYKMIAAGALIFFAVLLLVSLSNLLVCLKENRNTNALTETQ